MRAEVFVIGYARVELKSLAQRRPIQAAIKVNPFAAMIAPRFSAKGFLEAAGEERLFERVKMFAGHVLGL